MKTKNQKKIFNAILLASIVFTYVGLIFMLVSTILNIVALNEGQSSNVELFQYGFYLLCLGMILLIAFIIIFSETLDISWSRSFMRIHLKVSKWFIKFSDKALSEK